MTNPADIWLAQNAASVLDAVVDAIITIDETGTIQSLNDATLKMFGYGEDALLGSALTMLMPEPYTSLHQDFVEQYLTSGEAKIIGIGRELEALAADGRVFPIYLAISEIRADDRSFFVGIIRDLTQQKAAEEALLEQRERVAQVGRLSTMGEMTASIAHEINQPLTAIAMYAQACIRLLADDEFDKTRVVEALEKLNNQSLRAGAVIERIQRFVRNESGERTWVDMNHLLVDLEHLAAGDARLHDIELAFELVDDLPTLLVDEVQIQQVALNLIRNAIDAMHEIECAHGNTVKVTTALTDECVEVAVVDSGTGVPEDQQAELFAPFHTTKRDGMGMGLSICRSIIKEHGGVLDFENNPDHGARFFFRLPAEVPLEVKIG